MPEPIQMQEAAENERRRQQEAAEAERKRQEELQRNQQRYDLPPEVRGLWLFSHFGLVSGISLQYRRLTEIGQG